VCRLLASLHGSQAEVIGHLLDAAGSLAAAARAAWPAVAGSVGDSTARPADDGAGRPPRQPAPQRPRPARDRVQRINVE
jgi:hypothetical protein